MKSEFSILGLSPEELKHKQRIWALIVSVLVLVGIWCVKDFRWAPLAPSWYFILKGLGVSIVLSIFSICIGFILAVPLAVARVYGPPGVRQASVALIECIRSIPELMVIFWIFFLLPRIAGGPVDGWTSALIAMSLIAAAYLAEVIRAGLYAVPGGQWEAGLSTGLNLMQTFFRIVLPQALRSMLPAMLGQFIMLFKTTSLVYIVGVIDFFKAVQIINSTAYSPYASYTILAVGYFICCKLLSMIIYKIDPSYKVIE